MHRAHVENSLMTSFQATGFKSFCSSDLQGNKGLYETSRTAFVYKAIFFMSLPVPCGQDEKSYAAKLLDRTELRGESHANHRCTDPRVVVGTGDGRWIWEKPSSSQREILPLAFSSAKCL